MLYVYLDDQKKELTDRVVKSVEYQVEDQVIVVQRQPFILTRVSEVQVQATVFINFKNWTALEQIEIVCKDAEQIEKVTVPRANYFKNMMRHIYKMNTDLQDK